MGQWVAALMTAGVAGAGPVVVPQSTFSPAALDADLTVTAAVTCDVGLGQWLARWVLSTNSATATVLNARDPENALELVLSGSTIAPNDSISATGSLAGSVTHLTFEAVLQVAGEPSTRTIRRELTLGEGCTAAQPPPCVDIADARYLHTFDATAGRASVRIDGAPPCTARNLALTRIYWPLGYPAIDKLAWGQITPNRTRVEMYVDRLPCDHALQLRIGGTEVAYQKAELGMCLMPGVAETQTCSGLKLDLTNDADARLTADVVVLGPDLPGGTRQIWRYAIAPGESRTVLILPVGQPPSAVAQITINNWPIQDRVWVSPADCDPWNGSRPTKCYQEPVRPIDCDRPSLPPVGTPPTRSALGTQN